MAGETVKSEAICLRIVPWSRTSHVVTWLTPHGKVSSVVKGAVRPKSAFLGQYDLNYTCEIVYYARARGDLHALRECQPVHFREALRSNYRALVLAEYCRDLVGALVPSGPEAAEWYALLASTLDALAGRNSAGRSPRERRITPLLATMLAFELKVLDLSGLSPDLSAEAGSFVLRGERKIPVSSAVARCLRNPLVEKSSEILLDAARVIGVFYSVHVECAPDIRRTVLQLISQNEQGTERKDG